VGSIAYFRGDVLHFYWRDPEPDTRDSIKIPTPRAAWSEYYRFFAEALRFYQANGRHASSPEPIATIPELDITLKAHPQIAEQLLAGAWQDARRRARKMREEFEKTGYQPDGLQVIAGDSWFKRHKERVLRH
jgi:hypothetical protein